MKTRYKYIATLLLISIVAIFLYTTPSFVAGKKYQGTDDLIDVKMQQAAGIKAKAPLIDISKGNLGLFVFAVGGFTAGVAVGYYWRKIFKEKAGI